MIINGSGTGSAAGCITRKTNPRYYKIYIPIIRKIEKAYFQRKKYTTQDRKTGTGRGNICKHIIRATKRDFAKMKREIELERENLLINEGN